MEEESVPSLFPEFGDGELAGRSQDLMLLEPYFFLSIEHAWWRGSAAAFCPGGGLLLSGGLAMWHGGST